MATSLKDTLFNQEKHDEITSKIMTYEFEKKEAASKAEQDKKDVSTKAEIQRQKTIKNSIIGGTCILAFSAFFSFLFYKRKRDAEQETKETAAKLRISETELKALRLQINPHFIGNAMQTVQSYLREHKPEEAENLLIMFSKLTHAILENSEKEEISLRRELEILEWYMKIENERMAYPFSYKFDIDETIDVDDTFVPPNILQPFIENSIRHGLMHKSQPGNINIHVTKKDNDLHIIIEDDGIGREASKLLRQDAEKKESMGIRITQERINNLNFKNHGNSAIKIIDLIVNNKATGTRVELNLPL
jgi:LytS/YehU family sensor histidine kinase